MREVLASAPAAVVAGSLAVTILLLPAVLGRTRTEPLLSRVGDGSRAEWNVFLDRLATELDSVCTERRPPLILFTDRDSSAGDLQARGLLEGLECRVLRPTIVTSPSMAEVERAVIVDTIAGPGDLAPRWDGSETFRRIASISSETGLFRAAFFAPGGPS